MLVTMPVTALILAAACALLNLWLSIRVGQVRRAEGVSVGDGGNDRVIRRMRAHANFTENGWIVVALVLAIELGVGPSPWLWVAAGLFVLGRIGHGLGMDGWYAGRAGGTGITMAVQLALAVWALAIPLTAHRGGDAPAVETTVPQG